ncbi:MAG: alanine--tRNA ligase [Acidimicrobiia bacterium]
MTPSPRFADEIREAWLSFFEERGHKRVASSSLIPHDKSLLLTTAGMVQFKPFMLGEEKAPYRRATSVQKCFRTTDIDRIGITDRHFTFFEMLGNFSFGDYFKREALQWAWELVTEVWQLHPDRLWVTIFEEDDEAEQIWHELVGLKQERIIRRGKADNFWDMGAAGPCGPCSEIYYDRGDKFGSGASPADDETRYVEIWNLVFMEFIRDDAANVVGELPQKNIDTGAGLERVAMVLQGADSVFEVDTTLPILKEAQRLTGVRYRSSESSDVSLRVLTDHARASAFLIADGVFPSNEERGYVLRRIIRRAVRHARLLGAEGDVLTALALATVEVLGGAYPELKKQAALIERVCRTEESRFKDTLATGLEHLEQALERLSPGDVLSGEVVFRLHDTYGFPVDLTREVAQERGVAIDEEGFNAHMAEQRRRARQAKRAQGSGVSEEALGVFKEHLDRFGPTAFSGYERLEDRAKIVAIVRDGESLEMAGVGEVVEVLTDKTPFYGEAGGQVGDVGRIATETGEASVIDTTHPLFELTSHRVRVEKGALFRDQGAHLVVDAVKRLRTTRHHTATHVLHWALREVLGTHVKQAGSLVAPDRLRFDFSHFEQVRPEELFQVEQLANSKVIADQPVITFETTKDEAERLGALAFFGDKYGEIVRVVQAGDFSRELCGGTHVHALGEVGPVLVLSEGSIGSNLRRIEAVSGEAAVKRMLSDRRLLSGSAATLKAAPEKLMERVDQLLAELKAAQTETRRMRERLASQQAATIASSTQVSDVKGVRFVVYHLDDTAEGLRDTALRLRDSHGIDISVLGGVHGGRVHLVAVSSKRAVEAGLQAAQILAGPARLVGGGTGKNPELAVGGGPNTSALGSALDAARKEILDSLKSAR